MVRRLISLSKFNSLFIFGARGTGKSTLIQELFPVSNQILHINFLTEVDEDNFGRNPDQLSYVLSSKKYKQIVIDEVQKFPKILDIVHLEIEKNPDLQFILTGSSARKLKRRGANLLAGRAFTYSLFPFTHLELKKDFDLEHSLQFGDLPKVYSYKNVEDKNEYLKSYIKNYLKEEIAIEQIVRNIEPFRDFLEAAAQCNGQIINFSKIAKTVGVSDKTIFSYYQILEDTLIGFFLPPFHRSVRKRQREAPKFFFFDIGVKRAIEKTVLLPIAKKSFGYGFLFEHFIIKELIALNEYYKKDFSLSYLRTKDDAEIDLVIERPGLKDLLVEIKSSNRVTDEDCRTMNRFIPDWDRPCEGQLWSTDKLEKKIGHTICVHWTEGLKRLFG